jgi:hypothetical protein
VHRKSEDREEDSDYCFARRRRRGVIQKSIIQLANSLNEVA